MSDGTAPSTAAVDEAGLEALLELLRDDRGFDFTGYKRASLARRVQRRMDDVGMEGYDQYLDYNTWYRSDPGAKFSSQNIQSALDQRMAPDSPPLLFPVFKVLHSSGLALNLTVVVQQIAQGLRNLCRVRGSLMEVIEKALILGKETC